MLKKFLTSFGRQSVRSLLASNGKRANYLDKHLEVPNLPVRLGRVEPTILSSRCYIRTRGGKAGKSAEVDEGELAEAFDVEELTEDFLGPIEHLKAELRQRTYPEPPRHNIESFQFEYDGKTYKIEDVARVGKKMPTFYVLHFDGTPSAIPAVLSAIRSSDLNWSVQQEGTKIHLRVPNLEKDSKHHLRKECKMQLGVCKEELKIVQNKYLRRLNKQDQLGIEKKLKLQDQLQALTEELSKEAEKHLEEKLTQLQKDYE